MRIVRVDNVGRELLHLLREPPGRGEIQLAARRQRDELLTLRDAAAKLGVRMGDERRAVTQCAQAVDRQPHLVLAAAPRPGRVNVKREHAEIRKLELGIWNSYAFQIPNSEFQI